MFTILRYYFTVIALFLAMCSTAMAETYKWIDEAGNVHYSQLPPKNTQVLKIIAAPPKIDSEAAKKPLVEHEKKLQEIPDSRAELQNQQLKHSDNAVLKAENCEKAQRKLDNLRNANRIRAVDDEGNISRVGDAEKQRRIEDAQEKIKTWCN